MQKTKLIIGALALLTSVGIFQLSNINTVAQKDMINPVVGAEVYQKFEDFLTKYGKKYTPKEKIYRLSIFYKSLLKVIAHNKKQSTWTAGINKLSDMTQDEINIKYSTEYPDVAPEPHPKITSRAFKKTNDDPPAEINWVTKGAVTPVKDEGPCGSGYAFGAIEPYESAHFILYQELLSFSVQQIIDCSIPFGNKGCNVSIFVNLTFLGW